MGKPPDILKLRQFIMNVIENYRPVNTLSNLSKVFAKLVYSHINTCMSEKFSTYLTGFRRNRKTQHELLIRLRIGKIISIKEIKLDLSKAFDTLDHSLLKAKLQAYGFNNLSRIHGKLPNKQKTEM